jgi:1-hydroxycarotenoid 3,4-desaturase
MVTPVSPFPLDRHNVFFSADYTAEFDDIFSRRRMPRSPSIYLCAQDRPFAADVNGIATSATTERMLCLVNAPATGDRPTSSSLEIEACETSTFSRLAEMGLRIAPAADTTLRRTPADYAAMFPGTGGALYGRASHGWMASFKRPGSATSIPNLYLAGGSTHPGPGVPTSAISGRLAACAVLADLTSAVPYRRAAIRGGIWTARATLAATRSRSSRS